MNDPVSPSPTDAARAWSPGGPRAWPLPLVALAFFAFLALTAGWRPMQLPDEGRYVGVAWEMARSGDWGVPTMDALPFFHKPPLFYWLTGAALGAVGVNDLASRIAPLLGATIGALAVFVLLRRWAGEGAARIALVGLATQPLWFIGAQYANHDMLVAGLITTAIAALAHGSLAFERGMAWRPAFVAAGLAAGLAVLAKGLIGIVLPGLVIVAWLAWRRRGRTLLRVLTWLPMWLVFAIVVAPWFVAMQLRYPDFLHYFFVVQHFQRYSGTGFNNPQPVWFYPLLLTLSVLPWLPAWWLGRHDGRSAAAVAATAPRDAAAPAADAVHALQTLSVVWALAITVFFSLPSSKLLGYILPAVPALAAWFGLTLGARGERAWKVASGVGVAVSVALVAVFALRGTHTNLEVSKVLRTQRHPADVVVMWRTYAYDVPRDAGLVGPWIVVDDWGSPEIDRHDNWRKEIADAGKFEPARAQVRLVREDALASSALCQAPVAWIIVPDSLQTPLAWRAHGRLVARGHRNALWRVEPREAATAAALNCAPAPRTPTDVPPAR